VCGCGWSFAGITSARATTWGVVEVRSTKAIAAEVSRGKHLAGWSVIEGFEAHLLAAIRDIGERIRLLPTGTIVGPGRSVTTVSAFSTGLPFGDDVHTARSDPEAKTTKMVVQSRSAETSTPSKETFARRSCGGR
jgi:hypothetical protein